MAEKQQHSKSYHRFFENYAEREIPKPDGGYTIERVYVGKYYRVSGSDTELKKQKTKFLILYLISVFGYAVGALLAKISAVPLVALLTMPPLVTLIFFGIAIYHRLRVPREMEIREYRDSSEKLLFWSMATFVALALCFLTTLVCFIILRPVYTFSETVPSIVLYFIAAVTSLMTYLAEKAAKYDELPPKQERPEKSSPIRYEMPD
jgi:hypothetical protein